MIAALHTDLLNTFNQQEVDTHKTAEETQWANKKKNPQNIKKY